MKNLIFLFIFLLTGCGSIEVSGTVEVEGRTEHVIIVCPDDAEGDPVMEQLCQDILDGKVEIAQ